MAQLFVAPAGRAASGPSGPRPAPRPASPSGRTTSGASSSRRGRPRHQHETRGTYASASRRAEKNGRCPYADVAGAAHDAGTAPRSAPRWGRGCWPRRASASSATSSASPRWCSWPTRDTGSVLGAAAVYAANALLKVATATWGSTAAGRRPASGRARRARVSAARPSWRTVGAVPDPRGRAARRRPPRRLPHRLPRRPGGAARRGGAEPSCAARCSPSSGTINQVAQVVGILGGAAVTLTLGVRTALLIDVVTFVVAALVLLQPAAHAAARGGRAARGRSTASAPCSREPTLRRARARRLDVHGREPAARDAGRRRREPGVGAGRHGRLAARRRGGVPARRPHHACSTRCAGIFRAQTVLGIGPRRRRAGRLAGPVGPHLRGRELLHRAGRRRDARRPGRLHPALPDGAGRPDQHHDGRLGGRARGRRRGARGRGRGHPLGAGGLPPGGRPRPRHVPVRAARPSRRRECPSRPDRPTGRSSPRTGPDLRGYSGSAATAVPSPCSRRREDTAEPCRSCDRSGAPRICGRLAARAAPRARRGDPRRAGHQRREDRRPPRPQPRLRRADHRPAPGVRLPARADRLRHRPPGLRAQDAHRPGRGLRAAAPARRPVRLPEPRRERARLGREQPRLDVAVLRRRAGQGLRRPRGHAPGRRGHRRRRADRRHGLGGAEQHRRRARTGRSSSWSTTTAARTRRPSGEWPTRWPPCGCGRATSRRWTPSGRRCTARRWSGRRSTTRCTRSRRASRTSSRRRACSRTSA